MDNQEIFNQIRELQKQRTLLSAQDAALVNKINELRDKIALKNIKKGYYTDNNGLYCKVYDIKEDVIFVYEAHKNINGTYSPVLPFPTNEMAFNDFIYNVKYFTGNKYLVTGDLLDETGTDGEPLIKNVKILKKL